MVVAALAQLDRALKRALPLALAFIVVLLSVVPLPVPEYAVLAPSFALMSVFYWTVHRPDLFPAWGAFAVGLFDDMLSGAPLGLGAFVLLLVHFSIVAQHKVFRGKAFWLVWAAFAIVAFVAQLVTLLFGFALKGALPDTMPAATQLALTIALYPVATAVFGRFQRVFLSGG
ncbi:MAG: rod shape-determining protein MreD [Alphaproteobacteria bacterium]|nr:rod shape-determining protein MreD [Alphaproteobacteria bacterium]